MRIAVVAPSLDIVGGQSIQADALCAGLRQAGYAVDFVPINPDRLTLHDDERTRRRWSCLAIAEPSESFFAERC